MDIRQRGMQRAHSHFGLVGTQLATNRQCPDSSPTFYHVPADVQVQLSCCYINGRMPADFNEAWIGYIKKPAASHGFQAAIACASPGAALYCLLNGGVRLS